jgi:Cu(I)/Ag(I) efflux system periplasmic protein CusF
VRRNASLAVIAIAFALFALAGPSRSANDEASPLTHGIVKGVDAKAGTVTLDHEDVPGVMTAMTMTYGVADPAILQHAAVGQAVDFRLRKDGESYVVTEIQAGTQKPRDSRGGAMCCEGTMRDEMTGRNEHHEMK